jgi:hypothetical protein
MTPHREKSRQLAAPNDASSSSRIRFDLARALTAPCPRTLGEEIAITGSVARGVSDRYSDIEINFWVERLPAPEECQAWLETVGAQAEPVEDIDFPAGGFYTKSWFRGVFIESKWNTWDSLAASLENTLAVKTSDHWQLVHAWHIIHAVPPREGPRLLGWQQRLAHSSNNGALSAGAQQESLATLHWYGLIRTPTCKLPGRKLSMPLGVSRPRISSVVPILSRS